jgi:glycosyltransferase involved in cell wall biosynthesis
MAKVSVIVPVYNTKLYLQRSITSLMKQTLDDVEFIIIDDGSQDGSADIIREIVNTYPDRVEQVNLIVRENRGVAATRAQGVALATGEYVIHFDSDDWAREDMLELMYDKARLDDADIVVCDYAMSYQTKVVNIAQSVHDCGADCVNDLLFERVGNANWNKLVRRSLYTIHNINFVCGLDMGEDFLVTLRLFLKAKKVSHIPLALYFYNQENNGSLTKNHNQKSLNDIIAIIEHAMLSIDQAGFNQACKLGVDYLKLNLRAQFVVFSKGDAAIALQGLKLYPETNYMLYSFSGPKLLVAAYFLNLLGLFSLFGLLFNIWQKFKRN